MSSYFNSVEQTFKDEPIIKLWILRALVYIGREGGVMSFVDPDETYLGHALDLLSDELDEYYSSCSGIDPYLDDSDDEDQPRTRETIRERKIRTRQAKNQLEQILLKTAKERIASLQDTDSPLTVSEPLKTNVQRLGNILGLLSHECRILEFVTLLHTNTDLQTTFAFLRQFKTAELPRALSFILKQPIKNMMQAIHHEGRLVNSGLLIIKRTGKNSITQKLQLISDTFSDALMGEWIEPVDLLRNILKPAPAPTLSRMHYEHIEPSLSLLVPYLHQAVRDRKKGVNVFIHGKPGTGKTELTRLLATELAYPLYEIASEDEEGYSVNGNVRLRSYRTAQQLMVKHRAMLVFDEAEDIFGHDFSVDDSAAMVSKAWMNRTLEDNPVPCLWVSNSFSSIDPAFIRRFDMVIELPVPPKEQRARVLHHAGFGLLDHDAINLLAESEVIAPALVTRTGKVLNEIRKQIPDLDFSPAFEHLLTATLRTQGYRPPSRDTKLVGEQHFDVNYAQLNVDPEFLLNGLKEHPHARICCYGPPGTGKSALGLWLGNKLDMPVHQHRVSDLISPHPGASERNIAEAFHLADLKNALLIFDEADSFLRSRQQAQQLWEITQVNEMLTCMESFKGIFIATTNLFEGLDPASLRRFDLKLAFDYLNAQQVWAFFVHICSELNLEAPDIALQRDVHKLNRLTPGDFVLSSRRHRFVPFRDANALLQALKDEHELKIPTASKIGFY